MSTEQLETQSTDGVLPSERHIPISTVRAMCGGVSSMTIYRWLRQPDMGFPAPIYIARRRYWKKGDVMAWLESRAAGGAK